MKKTKSFMAVALVATMLVGNCMTVLAEEPVTTGNTTGTGTSEGHVEKEVLNVILPTIASGSTPFSYTMDPERLIQETDAAKYAEGTVFPDAEEDTGVYFLVGDNTYANTSNELQVINKSSCDVTITVEVQATQNTAKDIDLASSATVSTEDAELYLGLKVGASTQTVSDSKATVAKTIAGVPENFEVAVESGAYVYQEKATATDWKALNISMTGAVSEVAIASDTTAPTVAVTWSYAKAADDAEVDTADQVAYTSTPANAAPTAPASITFVKGTAYDVTTNLGSGDLAATAIASVGFGSTSNGSFSDAGTHVTIAGNKVTIKSDTWGSVAAGQKRYVKITFNDSANTSVVIEVTISE